MLRDEAMKPRDLPNDGSPSREKEGERGTHLVIAAALDPAIVNINIEFLTPPMKQASSLRSERRVVQLKKL
jgi:hypothetical protein